MAHKREHIADATPLNVTIPLVTKRVRTVGLTGLEPVTSALSGRRSNRLSYRPKPRPAFRPRVETLLDHAPKNQIGI